jgi:alpha-amylase
MPAVVLYFQVHQPFRLRRYSVFDRHHDYFDDHRNAEILRRVAEKCYRPATRILIDQARRHRGAFRVAFSISGTALDQLETCAPDVLDLFRALADTGCCEFLAETRFHSLASLVSPREFTDQIDLHAACIRRLFGQAPRTFRNTELIYSSDTARLLASMRDEHGRPRFRTILAEGVDHLLASRSPDQVFLTPAAPHLRLLLRNYRLSDDIAFRFSNTAWEHHPLTAAAFARWLAASPGPVVNLFMDYETFGEHQWKETGIFDFLAALPAAAIDAGCRFLTPDEASSLPAAEVYDCPAPTSWADTARDLSAWTGNAMQAGALEEHAALEAPLRAASRRLAPAEFQDLLTAWRRLGTSDHLYYMSTKYFADGDVHKYFNPYDSPYDSYINFMNVLDSLRARLSAPAERPPHAPGVPLPKPAKVGTIGTAGDRTGMFQAQPRDPNP